MPALTKFVDGTGPVVAGQTFSVLLHHHRLRRDQRFSHADLQRHHAEDHHPGKPARPIGYGAMCLESLVAIMAMIAACTLDPGVYLAMNIRAARGRPTAVADAAVAKVNRRGCGFAVSTARPMKQLAHQMGEDTLFGRTGGAPTLAVGMAKIFAQATRRRRWLDLWYHFALMFEALFILTTLDAGTRVGRYLLQDALGPSGTARRYAQPRCRHLRQRAHRVGLGLLPHHGRARSRRRHEGALADLRHRQSTPRQDRALPRDDHSLKMQIQEAAAPACPFLSYAHPARLAAHRHHLRRGDQGRDPSPKIGFLAAAAAAEPKLPALEAKIAAAFAATDTAAAALAQKADPEHAHARL